MKKIRVINGSNLNFTGIREKSIYGSQTLKDINNAVIAYGYEKGFDVECFQSNIEGEIINYLQKCYHDGVDGIIINPGAFTHYSYALKDAISSVSIPTVEVHISNLYKREDFRHVSVTASECIGQISGFGQDSYILAMEALKRHFNK